MSTERDYHAAKHDKGKPRPSLLPVQGLRGVMEVLEFGAQKYASASWQTVPDARSRYLDAALRHLLEVVEYGLDAVDEESGLPAIAHAACDLLFLVHFVKEDKQ